MPLSRHASALVGLVFVLSACGGSSSGDRASVDPVVCTGFGDWQQSPYVLPYTVGESYRVNQANCSGFGHSEFWQYGYDFEMPIGTVITAARAGVSAGDVIGLSGDTGNTGGLPHLHFSLHPCAALPGLPGTGSCDSIPVNFRNTDANPDGLVVNRTYESLPFD